MVRLSEFAIAASVFFDGSESIRLKSKIGTRNLNTYSFDEFVQEFRRTLEVGSQEHQLRTTTFQESLVQIRAHNSNEFRSWSAGINKFMDWTAEERRALNGYKPNRGQRSSLAALQTSTGEATFSNSTLLDSFQAESPPVRNQGNCGSCWAMSAVEAVEAQLMQKSQGGRRLSAQALVDCVPNPQHCGGSGGCDGATGELAYKFMTDYGIPMQQDLAYDAHTDACPVNLDAPWPTSQRVRLSGWNHIQPNNKAAPLMQSLVQNGPTVVAVDANNWFDYDSGIFDGCGRDATLGHAVLAVGYGKESGKDYWTIQNSWSSGWGESGHIRLLKHEDEDNFCGQDKNPLDGEGCDGGPAEVRVCGTCGILYDPIVPVGATIEGSDVVPFSPAPVIQQTETRAAPIFDVSEFSVKEQKDEGRDSAQLSGILSTPAGTETTVAPSFEMSELSGDEQKAMKTLFR